MYNLEDIERTTVHLKWKSNEQLKKYQCPRGHRYETSTPLEIAVNEDPNYHTGPLCPYCLVDWHKNNLNAEEVNA